MELISREKVLAFARTVYTTGSIPTQIVEVFDIKRLPAIESRPKGEWVKYKGEIYGLECSVCGNPAPLESEYGAYPCEKTNYCSNCGADMSGEAE